MSYPDTFYSQKTRELEQAYQRGRMDQNEICTPKLNYLVKCLEALNRIANIKDVIPWNAADAATECIRLAKQALKEQP